MCPRVVIDPARLPRHIAIVMDGNGRWAKKRGLPRVFGHRAGAKAVHRIVEECVNLRIEVVTIFAFSTENWTRPAGEIKSLMSILRMYLKGELPGMMKNNIRLRMIGDIEALPDAARADLKSCIQKTDGNTGLVLNIALNYGGRQELVRVFSRIHDWGDGHIDENTVSACLDTAGLPDPDLFIRTSGEMRISNFLLWQLAYTELYFTPTLWPDFNEQDLHRAIADYQSRDRRFGGI